MTSFSEENASERPCQNQTLLENMAELNVDTNILKLKLCLIDVMVLMVFNRTQHLSKPTSGIHRWRNGRAPRGTVPPLECEIFTLTLWELHGKNDAKSRWCPSLRSAAPPRVVTLVALRQSPVSLRWRLSTEVLRRQPALLYQPARHRSIAVQYHTSYHQTR